MLPLSPSRLGRYELVDEIGKGAMGVVYLARDPLIGRLVALKTFRIGYSIKDAELEQFRARFIREAQSAGILSHPNIVTIHDVVERGEEGLAFIAMEYVHGTNLKTVLQEPKRPSLAYVAEILAQIADGLDYAHSCKVIHRDIKPANILITTDSRVKITDFGIARLGTSNLTQEGQLLGTPNYMSPEQILGRDVDHRADIFSLGVVLYEMVTLHKPFQGDNLTVVSHRIVYDHFTPPREYATDLPPGADQVLARALEKDPARRYQRAREMADDLRRVLGGAGARDSLNETQGLSTTAVLPAHLLRPPAAVPSAAQALPSFASGSAAAESEMSGLSPVTPLAPVALLAPTTLTDTGPDEGRSPGSQAPRTIRIASLSTMAPMAPTAPAAGPDAPIALAPGTMRTQAVPIQSFAAPGVAPASPAAAGAAGGPSSLPGPGLPLAEPPELAAAAGLAPALDQPAPRPAPPLRPAAPAPLRVPLAPPRASRRPGLPALPSPRRLAVLVAAGAGLGLLVAGGLALWIRSWQPAAAQARETSAARRPGTSDATRVQVLNLMRDGRRRLETGDPEGAALAFRAAEQLAPGRLGPRRQREEAERQQGDRRRRLDQERTIGSKLEEGRLALADHRYEEAEAAAQAVLAMSPGNTVAEDILTAVKGGRTRSRDRAASVARQAQRAAAALPAARPEAPARGEQPVPPPTPEARDATLELAFFSQLPEGTLIVYVNGNKVLQESFRFYEKGRLFRSRPSTGWVRRSFSVKPGTVEIRVYVTPQGSAAVVRGVPPGNFAAGTSHRLEVQLTDGGQVTTQLN